MATVEEIIKALRCISSVHAEDEPKCDGCQYILTETIPEEDRAAFGGRTTWTSCDVDAVALDAAAVLEEMTGND